MNNLFKKKKFNQSSNPPKPSVSMEELQLAIRSNNIEKIKTWIEGGDVNTCFRGCSDEWANGHNPLTLACQNRKLDIIEILCDHVDVNVIVSLKFSNGSEASSNFNEKPYTEEKKCFTAKYVGETQVSQHSGMDVVNKSVAKLTHGQEPKNWPSVLIEVTTSEIKAIDCLKQTTTMTHRVRFITFLGVAHDERFGAYIVASDNLFVCHVYFCAPHSGTLTKAIEKACKLRFEKMLQGKAEQESSDTTSPPPVPPHNSVVKEKAKSLTSNMLGMFTRRSKKKEEVSHLNESEYEVKYFGSENVNIGTGIETLHTAIRALKNGETMQGYLQVLCDCIIYSDVNRSPLSKRVFQIDSISYCSMASDRKHFGIVVTCGKGNYACHVFQDISRNVGEVISSIHEII